MTFYFPDYKALAIYPLDYMISLVNIEVEVLLIRSTVSIFMLLRLNNIHKF